MYTYSHTHIGHPHANILQLLQIMKTWSIPCIPAQCVDPFISYSYIYIAGETTTSMKGAKL